MELHFETCAELAWPDEAERQAMNELPAKREVHAELVDRLDLLRRIEHRPPPRPAAPPGAPLRVAFWNAERCKHLAESAALLRRAAADVVLLCELDLGMARSGQAHTTRDLAERLGQGYAFAVEFVELGLGDGRERRHHAGERNLAGLHGAAILSSCALDCPALIRLERDGDWFDGSRGERRVGGRIALAARLPLAGVSVTVVCVHLESHGDPDQRADHMGRLLGAVERYAAGGPVVIGGDFNTNSAHRDLMHDPTAKRALLAEDATRLVDPVPYEPLFNVAAAAGYDWRACNASGPTQRAETDGATEPPLGKLDWFFSRGLMAADPAIVPAVAEDGVTAISDHELLAVSVAPATGDAT